MQAGAATIPPSPLSSVGKQHSSSKGSVASSSLAGGALLQVLGGAAPYKQSEGEDVAGQSLALSHESPTTGSEHEWLGLSQFPQEEIIYPGLKHTTV